MPSLKPTSVHRGEHQALIGLLRELRKAAGLTQAQVSQEMGIGQASVSDWETGERGLELLVVRDLVHVYGVDWLEFCGELERRLKAKPKAAKALVRGTKKAAK